MKKIMTSFLPSHQSANKVKSQTGILSWYKNIFMFTSASLTLSLTCSLSNSTSGTCFSKDDGDIKLQISFIPTPTLNLFNSLSDQDRISHHTISTASSKQVMRFKNISTGGLLVDSMPNSSNPYHKNCIADSKGNYKQY